MPEDSSVPGFGKITSPAGKLTSPAVVKQILKEHRLSPRHSLGQNFLISDAVLNAIYGAAELTSSDLVIEVGPGIGTLTRGLCERAGRVLAIELDRGLLPVLERTLSGVENVEVIHGDVLKVDLKDLIGSRLGGPIRRAKAVANLPYYVTTPILLKLLEENLPINLIVVMVQKEVAARMISPPGNKDYGALSVAVQYYAEPEVVARAPRSAFLPAPEVESAVVRLRVHEVPPVGAPRAAFFRVVRASFAQRRKTIGNCLAAAFRDKEAVARALGRAGIEAGRRGETLGLPEFAALTRALISEISGLHEDSDRESMRD